MRPFLMLRTCFLVAWLAGSVASAAADARTFPAVGDNTLYDASPANLSNGAGAYMFVGKNANGQARRALVRFDLSTLPAGSVIQSAQLQLYLSQTTNASSVLVHVHKVSADWGEGSSDAGGTATGGGGGGASATPNDATWSHRLYDTAPWSAPGGDFTPAASASQNVLSDGFYSWTGAGLGADVQAWIASPSQNFGWALVGDESAQRTAKRFNTRENSDAATRAQLFVVYSPPAASVPVPLWSAFSILLALLITGSRARARS